MMEVSRTIIHTAPASLAAPLPARAASANMAAGTRIKTRKVSPSHTPRRGLKLGSEVLPPPAHHDAPPTQHEPWFLWGASPRPALSTQFGQAGPPNIALP